MKGSRKESVFFILVCNLLLYGCSSSIEPAGSQLTEGKYSFEGVCEEGHSAEFETSEGGCKYISENTVWSSPLLKSSNYQAAFDHCSGLDNGWDDWRLPYVNELLEIAGPEKGHSALSYLTKGYYWSKVSGNSSQAVAVDLNEVRDNKTLLDLQEPARVLCVRDGYTPKEGEGCKRNSAEFWTSTGGCRHLASGLTWSKPVGTKLYQNENYDDQDADDYCGGLHQGGYRDWRPPTSSDFLSLSVATRIDLQLGDYEEAYFENQDPSLDRNYFKISSANFEILQQNGFALICARGENKDHLVQR